MAYNNGYPEYSNGYMQNTFLPYPYNQSQFNAGQVVHPTAQNYMNPMNQMNSLQQGNNGGIIWVQGEAGARAFSNVRPDAPVALWDSEESVIYIKSIDSTGKPSMTILDYTERNSEEQKESTPKIEYATKEQIDNLTNQYTSFTEQLKELSGQVKDIENRITSFGKPQQNTRRGSKQ